jgi:hypothetical protein
MIIKNGSIILDNKLVKKDETLYPFNEAKASQISDLIAIEFDAEINKSYVIKIYLK